MVFLLQVKAKRDAAAAAHAAAEADLKLLPGFIKMVDALVTQVSKKYFKSSFF